MLAEQNVPYKTYLKRALVEALGDVFQNHVDDLLRKTKVTVEWPTTRDAFPTVIVRFFERTIMNAGIGHVEYIMRDTEEVIVDKFKHYFYNGDIEFAVFTLSSLDRDLVSDSLVQTLAMGDLTGYTNRFLNRIYSPSVNETPQSKWNFVNINTDQILGFGETQTLAPWQPEDQLMYQTSYRSAVFGEFYSLPPTAPVGMVERVNFFPYIGGVEPSPEAGDAGETVPKPTIPIVQDPDGPWIPTSVLSDDPGEWQ